MTVDRAKLNYQLTALLDVCGVEVPPEDVSKVVITPQQVLVSTSSVAVDENGIAAIAVNTITVDIA